MPSGNITGLTIDRVSNIEIDYCPNGELEATEHLVPFGANYLPVSIEQNIGKSALSVFPFGHNVMTSVHEALEETHDISLGRKLSGSLPTNKLTTVYNPNSKSYNRLSDGSDTSPDD